MPYETAGADITASPTNIAVKVVLIYISVSMCPSGAVHKRFQQSRLQFQLLPKIGCPRYGQRGPDLGHNVMREYACVVARRPSSVRQRSRRGRVRREVRAQSTSHPLARTAAA